MITAIRIIGCVSIEPLAKRVRSKWPAIILAAKRTDKVSGRIDDLIISIITIKGIRATGVPKGTRWASIAWGVFKIASVICPTHSGKASVTEKVKCLEAVKV